MTEKAAKSVVGDLINFRGLVYAPINENGVIFLFGKIADDLNMYIEEIKPGFPDCIGRRFIGKGWEKVSIEFEFKSSNFKQHKHKAEACDIIVCWVNDWKDCPIEVIELKTEIQGLENYPVTKPESGGLSKDGNSLDNLFKNTNSTENIIKCYDKIIKKLNDYNQDIWVKVGKIYMGLYAPERAFVSVKPSSQSIKFECYSGSVAIENTTITNTKYAPNWCKFYVKNDNDVDKAFNILKESHIRIKKALESGKNTGYFSGGAPFGAAGDIIDGAEEDN
jgi:hypothetical protein